MTATARIFSDDDSYSRIPAQLELGRPNAAERAPLLAVLTKRLEANGYAPPHESVLAAHLWGEHGYTGTVETLARELGYARRTVQRALKLLEVLGLGDRQEIPHDFGRCTHTAKKGWEGFHECTQRRREAGITWGCSAHHSGMLFALRAALTAEELATALALPRLEMARRIAAREDEERTQRARAGRQANDYEGRRLRGAPLARGPKGTNHTSAERHPSPPVEGHVTPHPPGSVKENLTNTASTGRGRGDTADAPSAPVESLAPSASDVAPSAPRLSCVAPQAASDAPGGNRLGREGEHDSCRRERPGGFTLRLVDASATVIAWFLAEWAARGLAPLGDVDRRTLRARARQVPRGDLELGIRRAARTRATFLQVFANRQTLHELVHEERMREPPPTRPREPDDEREERARAAELARRQLEQLDMLEALERGELLEIPIRGSVK